MYTHFIHSIFLETVPHSSTPKMGGFSLAASDGQSVDMRKISTAPSLPLLTPCGLRSVNNAACLTTSSWKE